eukprot:scaffold4510_cov183-Amphora_coffeaeformis.AAC.104
MQVVPELGLGNHRVGCENNHSVRFRVGVLFRGGMATHNLVLAHKSCNSHPMQSKQGQSG